MAPRKLTKEQKIDYFNGTLGIAGIRFDNPNIVSLMVTLYDEVLEKQGKIGIDEVVEIKNKWVKENQAPPVKKNEPARKNVNPGQNQ